MTKCIPFSAARFRSRCRTYLWAIAVVASSVFVMSQDSLASDPVGVWRGEWTSNSTGHRGPMRVVIREQNDGRYQARFSGRFLVVIPFMYRATLVPSSDPYGNVILDANKRLGLGMGSYTMRTTVVGNQLQGSFSAARDRGSVTMCRVR
jgi:hypothetical protein